MRTVSNLFSEELVPSNVQYLDSMDVGKMDKTGTSPIATKTTPELKRIARKELEAAYIKEPITFNLVNTTTKMVMSASYHLDGTKDDVKFFTDLFSNIGYYGGTHTWKQVLYLSIQHQVMFGNAYIEMIPEKTDVKSTDGNIGKVLDLDIIDPKQMDYAKDSDGNIKLDMYGRPVGFVQTLPENTTVEGQKFKPPKGVVLLGNQIYIPKERICHLKLHLSGDDFYPIGFIEPAYNYITYKLKLEAALVNAIWRHGFPIYVGKFGDVNHMPTPAQIQNLLNNMGDMTHQHEIAIPYFSDISILEAKNVTQLKEHLSYFSENIITSFGTPQAIASCFGETTNRATLNSAIKVFENNLTSLVENTTSQLEYKLFMPISRSYNRSTIPSFEWDAIETEGLKSELEKNTKESVYK